MKKRFFYEKTETRVTNVKGYVDIETDYVQIYKNFATVSAKINSVTAFKLLHWLLAERLDEANGLNANRLVDEFNTHMYDMGGTESVVSRSTFHRALSELVQVGALTRLNKASYHANPNLFWCADTQARLNLLKANEDEGTLTLLNP
jgi:hypothetical protein